MSRSSLFFAHSCSLTRNRGITHAQLQLDLASSIEFIIRSLVYGGPGLTEWIYGRLGSTQLYGTTVSIEDTSDKITKCNHNRGNSTGAPLVFQRDSLGSCHAT